jgi:hypothetical protein
MGSGLKDTIARGWGSAGDVGDEKGRIFQCAHAEIGGFFLIPDAHQEVAGFGALERGGINQDESIFPINRFDDSDEAGNLSLRRFGFAGKEVGYEPKPGDNACNNGPLRLGSLGMRDSGLAGRGLRSLSGAAGDQEATENHAGRKAHRFAGGPHRQESGRDKAIP